MFFHHLLNQAPSAPTAEQGANKPTPVGNASAPIRGPPQHGYPHLTCRELAGRWRVTTYTLSANYRKWGLNPIRIGKRLLFPIDQIEAAERRTMNSE
jgi:hypothetical protein